jgi:hypothetical protein
MEERLRLALIELCDAIEDSDAVREVGAGEGEDGPYARACHLLGRPPKWPDDWDSIPDLRDEDSDLDGDGNPADHGDD